MIRIINLKENLENQMLYHGSDNVFDSFNFRKTKRGKSIFLTSDKTDAHVYGDNIYKVRVLRDNLFDYRSNRDLQLLYNCVEKQLEKEKNKPYDKREDFYPYTKSKVFDGIRRGAWNFLAQPLVQKCIRKLGYNGHIEVESGREQYAFYNPRDLEII